MDTEKLVYSIADAINVEIEAFVAFLSQNIFSQKIIICDIQVPAELLKVYKQLERHVGL